MKKTRNGITVLLILSLLLSTSGVYAQAYGASSAAGQTDTQAIPEEVDTVEESSGISLTVYTDKKTFEVGEQFMVRARLRGVEDVTDTQISVGVIGPGGTLEFDLKASTCASSSECLCPKNQPGCMAPCETIMTCSYGSEFMSLEEPGEYEIYAVARSGDQGTTAQAKFTVREKSEYKLVRLGEEFTLSKSWTNTQSGTDTAVVVDYDDMKIQLLDVDLPDTCPAGALCKPSAYHALLEVSMRSGNAWVSKTIRVMDNTGGTVFDAVIYADDLEKHKSGFSGVFKVVKHDPIDYVDIKVTPVSATVKQGEKATYKISVKDRRPIPEIYGYELKEITYQLEVSGLPFDLDYPKEVKVLEGQTKEVELVVDTSVYGSVRMGSFTQVEEVEMAVEKTEVVDVEEAAVAEVVAVEEAEAVAGEVEDAVAKPVPVNGYRFRVKVVEKGNPEANDVAYARLKVVSQVPDKIKLAINRGWNLITLPGKGSIEMNDCSNDMQAFVYLKEQEKYFSMEEASSGNVLGGLLADYLRLHSFWIYAYDACEMLFDLDQATSVAELSPLSGWNFLPVTEDMIGRTLDEVSGDCDFENVYLWRADQQAWDGVSSTYEFEDEDLYNGFVAKAENSCDMGWGVLIPPAPPALPE